MLRRMETSLLLCQPLLDNRPQFDLRRRSLLLENHDSRSHITSSDVHVKFIYCFVVIICARFVFQLLTIFLPPFLRMTDKLRNYLLGFSYLHSTTQLISLGVLQNILPHSSSRLAFFTTGSDEQPFSFVEKCSE